MVLVQAFIRFELGVAGHQVAGISGLRAIAGIAHQANQGVDARLFDQEGRAVDGAAVARQVGGGDSKGIADAGPVFTLAVELVAQVFCTADLHLPAALSARLRRVGLVVYEDPNGAVGFCSARQNWGGLAGAVVAFGARVTG